MRKAEFSVEDIRKKLLKRIRISDQKYDQLINGLVGSRQLPSKIRVLSRITEDVGTVREEVA